MVDLSTQQDDIDSTPAATQLEHTSGEEEASPCGGSAQHMTSGLPDARVVDIKGPAVFRDSWIARPLQSCTSSLAAVAMAQHMTIRERCDQIVTMSNCVNSSVEDEVDEAIEDFDEKADPADSQVFPTPPDLNDVIMPTLSEHSCDQSQQFTPAGEVPHADCADDAGLGDTPLSISSGGDGDTAGNGIVGADNEVGIGIDEDSALDDAGSIANEEHEQRSPVYNTPEDLPGPVLVDSEVDDDSASEGCGDATDCLEEVHTLCPDEDDVPDNSSLTAVQVDDTVYAQRSPVCRTPDELSAYAHESENDDEHIQTDVVNEANVPDCLLYRPPWHCEVLRDPNEN